MTSWASAYTSLVRTAAQIQLLLTLSVFIQNACVSCQSTLHVSVNSNSLSESFSFYPQIISFGELSQSSSTFEIQIR